MPKPGVKFYHVGATHQRRPTQARCWSPSGSTDSIPTWVAKLVTWDEEEQSWAYLSTPISHAMWLVEETGRTHVMSQGQFRDEFEALPEEPGT